MASGGTSPVLERRWRAGPHAAGLQRECLL